MDLKANLIEELYTYKILENEVFVYLYTYVIIHIVLSTYYTFLLHFLYRDHRYGGLLNCRALEAKKSQREGYLGRHKPSESIYTIGKILYILCYLDFLRVSGQTIDFPLTLTRKRKKFQVYTTFNKISAFSV